MKFLIDTKLKRPACVLLQAAAGTDIHDFQRLFGGDSTNWLVAPTPNMAIIDATEQQWRKFIADPNSVTFRMAR